ncbi:hypothetical protein IMSAG049_01372 [Clostridiales bacterium]|nr:hypothetical protein IMSAG049_01372 [Clostridiales bacterium]
MIRINNLKLKIDDTNISRAVCKQLKISSERLKSVEIRRKSLDARKKDSIHYLYSVDITAEGEEKILRDNRDRNISRSDYIEYTISDVVPQLDHRPVIVGFGPAGMFSALALAESGLKPIVIERGRDADSRTKDVETFWSGGAFNPESNVQFGEGGAGTFSDGKLTTRTKDKRVTYVTKKLLEAGAPEEIAYEAKPHIGTDKLRDVVKNIRKKIIALGGEVRFESKLIGIEMENGEVIAVIVNDKEKIYTKSLILAIGHSARDTLEMLFESGIKMEQKPFAAGVRIEHSQRSISLAQYGEIAEKLPPADYMLTYTTKAGRGVYTFCMCPGGYVVAAASEKGRLAVNGMSEYKRDGKNANSALLVQINPEDFGSDSPLAGMELQRRIEEKAFEAGGENYFAPAQRYEDFVKGRITSSEGSIIHSYRPGIKYADLNNILPEFITEAMKEAIPQMGRKLKGFAHPDALMTGVETRSSSPVRILRETDGCSVSLRGLYPTGEGAGYAGGIVSAAIDGVRQAENLIENNLRGNNNDK